MPVLSRGVRGHRPGEGASAAPELPLGGPRPLPALPKGSGEPVPLDGPPRRGRGLDQTETMTIGMSKKRRNTIPLEEFQQAINEVLASDESHPPEWRQGLFTALHLALNQANNYGGWEYLETAGIDYEVVNGELRQRVEDRTRRRFYSLDEVEEEAEHLYSRPSERRAPPRPDPDSDPDNPESDWIFRRR